MLTEELTEQLSEQLQCTCTAAVGNAFRYTTLYYIGFME